MNPIPAYNSDDIFGILATHSKGFASFTYEIFEEATNSAAETLDSIVVGVTDATERMTLNAIVDDITHKLDVKIATKENVSSLSSPLSPLDSDCVFTEIQMDELIDSYLQEYDQRAKSNGISCVSDKCQYAVRRRILMRQLQSRRQKLFSKTEAHALNESESISISLSSRMSSDDNFQIVGDECAQTKSYPSHDMIVYKLKALKASLPINRQNLLHEFDSMYKSICDAPSPSQESAGEYPSNVTELELRNFILEQKQDFLELNGEKLIEHVKTHYDYDVSIIVDDPDLVMV